MIHLVTGFAGYEHIKSADDGALNAGIVGTDKYVMNVGNKFSAYIIDNNTIRISDGEGMMYGRHFRIEPNAEETVSIATGTAGENRIDLICATYHKNTDNETERVYLTVIKGYSTAGVAEVPYYNNTNILNGWGWNESSDFPLYRVDLEGVNIKSVTPLFEVLPTHAELIEQLNVETIHNAGGHNSIYRGKNLGSVVTDEQWEEIKLGRFRNLYIGDYWTINGVNWRIACFDYYYNTGYNPSCKTHQITLVPDTALYNYAMNDTDIVTGAYVGSKMYTEGLAQAKEIIISAFGSAHILNHRQYLQNAVTNGYASGGSWYDSTVELMNESNVFGGNIYGNIYSTSANRSTLDNSQFPLFAFRHDLISIDYVQWLRDVTSSSSFSVVVDAGNAASFAASRIAGVRPAFSICQL